MSKTRLLYLSLFRQSKPFLISMRYKSSVSEVGHNEGEANVLNALSQGKILAKIIAKEEHWEDHLLQLSDYNYRPPLREQKVFNLEKPVYQYVHLTGEIKTIKPDEPTPGVRTHTQKTSTTYVSHFLHTKLFTCFTKYGQVPMGTLHHMDHCVIKGMISNLSISPTYFKDWVSDDLNKVLEYKKMMEEYSFTNFHEFKQEVDTKIVSNPHDSNEVLAELSKRSLCGLVLDVTVRDFPYYENAIQKVQKKLKEVKATLGTHLPMVFYNSHKRKVRIFTKSEQQLYALHEELKNTLDNAKKNENASETFAFSMDEFVEGRLTIDEIKNALHLMQNYFEGKLSLNDTKENIKLIFRENERDRIFSMK